MLARLLAYYIAYRIVVSRSGRLCCQLISTVTVCMLLLLAGMSAYVHHTRQLSMTDSIVYVCREYYPFKWISK